MSAFLRKYNTATASGTHIGLPMIKAGAQDFAVSADWTPVAGDVKVSIDGGAQANITTLPSYSNGQWIFQLSGAETTGKSIRVAVVDSTTKAVEDQFFIVETFGHASAAYQVDLSAANLTANVKEVNGTAQTARDLGLSVLVGDKTGFSLTSGERTSIANEVEAQIIDDTDSEKVLQAITDKIASVNPSLAGLTLAAIASTVRDVALSGASGGSLGAAITAILTDYMRRTDGLSTQAKADVTAAVPTVNAIADGTLDRANGVETGLTLRQWLRLGGSVLFGKSNNDGSTFRDFGDTKDRIVATVDDDGNRTAVTRDAT